MVGLFGARRTSSVIQRLHWILRESRRRWLQTSFIETRLRKVRTPERPDLLDNVQCERSRG